MLLEICRTVASADPRRPPRAWPQESALASFHPLILALCRETRRFPAGDPLELGLGIRAAALAAAEAVLASSQLPAPGHAPLLEEAVCRLRELAYCIGIARYLRYLSTARAAELQTLHARASHAVYSLAHPASRGSAYQPAPISGAVSTITYPQELTVSPTARGLAPR